MIQYQLYFMSLAATVIGSIGMAVLLWFKAGRKDIVKPLVFFCLGVAVWITGYLLIGTGVKFWIEAGRFLINLSPLISATFLHFVLSFGGKGKRKDIFAIYFVAATSVAAALIFHAGEIGPWLQFSHFYHLDRAGIALASVTLLFSLAAHLLLLRESMSVDRKRQRQMLALFVSGGWGLMSASGFVFESIGLDIFPYPLLLLPFYTLLLAYGVLRYELMDVNVWARRAITWAMVLLIPILAVSVILALLVKFGLTQFSGTSLWLIWILSLIVVLISALIQKPAALVAERIVYPGSRISPETLKKWQDDLESAEDWEQLSAIAGRLLSAHMGYEVEVTVASPLPESGSGKPGMSCNRDGGVWRYILSGWEDAAPALLHAVNMFGAVLVATSARLEALLKIAEKEREILIESHLTDLGRLSATVAHELRNPLNIISMASAGCESEIKKEISHQLERSQKLIDDLLAYSGKLNIEKKRLNLKEEVDYILSHYKDNKIDKNIEMSGDLFISFDQHRLHQVFFNLMNNACSLLEKVDNPKITIKASGNEEDVKLIFGNNGPAIPDDIAGEIFRPFVSGRAGGSGLGLAIVQRIMEVHGGRIMLAGIKGGDCRFELIFPVEK